MLSTFGYRPREHIQNEYVLAVIRHAFSTFPAVFCLLATMVLLLYPAKDDELFHSAVQKGIADHAAGKACPDPVTKHRMPDSKVAVRILGGVENVHAVDHFSHVNLKQVVTARSKPALLWPALIWTAFMGVMVVSSASIMYFVMGSMATEAELSGCAATGVDGRPDTADDDEDDDGPSYMGAAPLGLVLVCFATLGFIWNGLVLRQAWKLLDHPLTIGSIAEYVAEFSE